eukprot:5224978-Pyramimonas_sp.AAC.1
MGSEDHAASPMHRRCGSMWSPWVPTPKSPLRRRRHRCIADVSACSDPIQQASTAAAAFGRPLAL